MNPLFIKFKRKLAHVFRGGLPLLALLGAQSCMTNAARTNFLTAAGDNTIDAAAVSADNGDPLVNAALVPPTAGLLKDLWATWVGLHIPLDPLYQNDLLIP